MNFGETIGYWYLRFNGFFPLQDFVIHRSIFHGSHNSDADLLAIRHPYVEEDVGGSCNDWDEDHFSSWGMNLATSCICLIVEVKTGPVTNADLNRAFATERLKNSLRRFGVLTSSQIESVVADLAHNRLARHETYCFGKLLISNETTHSRSEMFSNECLHLRLIDAVAFLRNRVRRYQTEKFAARMFFPSDLIQFLAWEATQQSPSSPTSHSEREAFDA